jgi:hypothetical protein
MVVKETTNLGGLFLKAALDSVLRSHFATEIVFIDNGCSSAVREIYEHILNGAKYDGIEVKTKIVPEDVPFGHIRNIALDMMSPFASWVVWRDSDEISVPEVWKNLPAFLQSVPATTGRVLASLQHLMIEPTKIMPFSKDSVGIPKDCILRVTPGSKWDKPVHESFKNGLGGVANCDYPYVHLGYCRAQWRTCLKWFRYAVLEHGNLNVYKHENVEVMEDGKKVLRTLPWFRDWRNPNAILDDRKTICVPYEGPKPTEFSVFANAAADPGWEAFLRKTDTEEFFETWKAKAEAEGGWVNTLDWVQSEMEKSRWNQT